MSLVSKKAFMSFKLNGKTVSAPIEWQDISIKANFPNDAIQPSLDIDTFTFTLDEAGEIRQYILDGLNGGVGIFEGMPFEITTTNKDNSLVIFDGYLDLTDGFEDILSENKVNCKLRKRESLEALFERLEGLTYGYLDERLNMFSNSDFIEIEYIVEKKFNAIEILTNSILLFVMANQAATSIKNTADLTSDAIMHITGQVAPPNPISAAIWASIKALTVAGYTVIMLNSTLDLYFKMFRTFFPPKRKAKVATLRTLIEKPLSHLGYTLESNIADLELAYLPSNYNIDELDNEGFIFKTKGVVSGVPNTQDFGYRCSEMFSLIQSMFNAKYAVKDNVVQLYNLYDPFWMRNSTYVMPSIVEPIKKYNTQDLKENQFYTFTVDQSDEWTINNFKGTNYEVLVDADSKNNPDAVYLKNISVNRWSISLGDRKDKLNALETAIKLYASAVDDVVRLFGGEGNLAQKIKDRVGMLHIGQNNYRNSKILRLDGNNLNSNHRDNLSAKYLENTYYSGGSFVRGDYGQKLIYEEIDIPFGLEDLLKLLSNSYFRTFDNKIAKAVLVDWNIASDRATINYFIYERYTNNLKEIFIEA